MKSLAAVALAFIAACSSAPAAAPPAPKPPVMEAPKPPVMETTKPPPPKIEAPAPKPPNPDLLVHLKLDDGPADASGNNHAAVVQGKVGWGAGKIGNAA